MHLPFEDRIEAGRLLAAELSRHQMGNDAIVIALPTGGVPVAFAISERLHLPMDVVESGSVPVPWQPEISMGAIGGSERVLNDKLVRELGVPDCDVLDICGRERAHLAACVDAYRGGRPAVDLCAHQVILVDHGMATGARMLAAIRSIRARRPARLTVAVPVASQEACTLVRPEVDDLVCLTTPEHFYAVGEWYRDFERVTNKRICNLLKQSRQNQEMTASRAR